MNSDFIAFYLMLICFAFIAFIAVWITKEKQKKWQTFAHKYNLNFKSGSFFKFPEVSGNYKNIQIKLSRQQLSGGRGKRIETVFEAFIKHPPDLAKLRIYNKSIFANTGKVATNNLETGDPDFDNTTKIKCNCTSQDLRAYLNEPLRRAILIMLSEYPSGRFTENGCHINQSGFIGETKKIEHIFDLLINCCTLGDESNN